MALAGSLVIENFGYGVSDAELPLFTGEDEPLIDEETGEQKVLAFKILTLEPAAGLAVEIRVAEAEWDGFLEQLAKDAVPAEA